MAISSTHTEEAFSNTPAIITISARTEIITAVTLFFSSGRIKDRFGSLMNYEYALIILLALLSSPIMRTQHLIFLVFPAFFALSLISGSGKNYKFLYRSFIIFASLYLSLSIKLFAIFGFGTISILWLWYVILVRYRAARAKSAT